MRADWVHRTCCFSSRYLQSSTKGSCAGSLVHNGQGLDHSMALRSRVADSTIFRKFKFNGRHILVIIVSVWASLEEFVIWCCQEDDLKFATPGLNWFKLDNMISQCDLELPWKKRISSHSWWGKSVCGVESTQTGLRAWNVWQWKVWSQCSNLKFHVQQSERWGVYEFWPSHYQLCTL
jgi:hypothetical protein